MEDWCLDVCMEMLQDLGEPLSSHDYPALELLELSHTIMAKQEQVFKMELDRQKYEFGDCHPYRIEDLVLVGSVNIGIQHLRGSRAVEVSYFQCKVFVNWPIMTAYDILTHICPEISSRPVPRRAKPPCYPVPESEACSGGEHAEKGVYHNQSYLQCRAYSQSRCAYHFVLDSC